MTQQDAARDLANLAVRAASALHAFGAKELAHELDKAVRVFDQYDK